MVPHHRLIRLGDRMWVAAGRASGIPHRPHPIDAAAASGMPRWRAAEFLTGRALLRSLLHEVRPSAADAEVLTGDRGKPRLPARYGVGISISHDGGEFAAFVAENRAVGIDVQRPPARPDRALLRKCLRGNADRVAELPARQAALELAWVWTAQEACVKATGAGIAASPWSINVTPGSSGGRWGDYRWISLREHSAVPLSCAFGPEEQGERS